MVTYYNNNNRLLTSLPFHSPHKQTYNAFVQTPKSSRVPGFMVTSRKVENDGLD